MEQEDHLIAELIKTGRLCRTLKSELLIKHGLYAGQDSLLKSLESRDGQSMSELARSLNVRPPTVTKMVTRMAVQGVIEKRPSKEDNRQSNVFITARGQKMLKKVNKAWRKAEKTALKNVKTKWQKQLAKSFKKINLNLTMHKDNAQLDHP